MPFPKTETELAAAGYVFENTSKCNGQTCGATIAWYRTPAGKRMPLDEGTLEPHWGTCPDRDTFTRRKK
jgi:hypothetical protein